MSVVTSTASHIDNRRIAIKHGYYDYSPLTPNQPLASVNSITNAGGQMSKFDIPGSAVFNLSKTVLSFTSTPVGETSLVNGDCIWKHIDTIPEIQSIVLRDHNTNYLAKIPDANIFIRHTIRKNTKLDDLLTRDFVDDNVGYAQGLHPSRSSANVRPVSHTDLNTTTAYDATIDYTEGKYLVVGDVKDSTATPAVVGNTTPVVKYQIELNNIKDSIFTLEEDLYLNQTLTLEITWAPARSVYWISSSPTNPSVGVKEYSNGNITISDLTLYLAQQQDPAVKELVMSRVLNGGHEVGFDYTLSNLFSLKGLIHNIQERYESSDGLLKKIIWIPLYTQSKNTKYDSSVFNSDGSNSKIKEFYTLINGNKTENYVYEMQKGNEWMSVKNSKLKGSAVQSSEEFYNVYSHVYDFQNPDMRYYEGGNKIMDGKKLQENESMIFSIKATSVLETAGINDYPQLEHRIYTVVHKTLRITPGRIDILV